MYRDEKIIGEEFARFRQASLREAGLMTQANATFVLNLSKQRLSDLVQSGRFHWHEFFDTKFLSCREVAAFKKLKRKPGRPSGKSGKVDETDAK